MRTSWMWGSITTFWFQHSWMHIAQCIISVSGPAFLPIFPFLSTITSEKLPCASMPSPSSNRLGVCHFLFWAWVEFLVFISYTRFPCAWAPERILVVTVVVVMTAFWTKVTYVGWCIWVAVLAEFKLLYYGFFVGRFSVNASETEVAFVELFKVDSFSKGISTNVPMEWR